MKHFFLIFTLSMVLVPCALQAEAQGAPSDFVPVTDSMLQNPDPADWLMWRRTLDGWGYSPLDQVDRENVSELRMVWSQALVQEGGSQQGTPLVYDGILYMPNPHDVIRALNAVTGERIWEYRRKWPEDLTTFLRDPGRKTKPGHLWKPDYRLQRRRFCFRHRCPERQAGLGNTDPRLQNQPRPAELRSDHRRWKGDLRSKLLFRRRARGLRHHRP